MHRFSSRVIQKKRDTPMKTALRRSNVCRRLLPKKLYEAIPEEHEVAEISVRPANPMLTSRTPVHHKFALHLSSPAFTGYPRAVSHSAPAQRKSGHQASPAGHSAVQRTPDAEAAVTPESITSSSTIFSSDDDEDDEEEEASATSSSLPSPEIFREESHHVETPTSPIEEELLDLHHLSIVKNSTLLDASHAKNIHMQRPPNLSTIIDASAVFAENSCESNQHRQPKTETNMHRDSVKSGKAFKFKTPSKLTNRRLIFNKKKVWFKSPLLVETTNIPTTKMIIYNASEPAQTSSPVELMKPDADLSSAGEISSNEEELLMVRLKRPLTSNPEKAKFFDFIDDGEGDAFFQMMRERCVKLKSAPLFPLTATNTDI